VKNNQHNQIRRFLSLIQVQAVLYAVISATSYYWFHGSTPFESHVVVYGQQRNSYSHSENTGRIHLAMYKEACGVSIHEYTVVDSVFEQSLVNDSSANTAYILHKTVQYTTLLYMYISFHIKDM